MPDHAPTPTGRRIALIAHDNKKQDMLEWAEYNLALLAEHQLFATATTGRLPGDKLGLPVTCFLSGPFGGDQQPALDHPAMAGFAGAACTASMPGGCPPSTWRTCARWLAMLSFCRVRSST